MRKKNLNQSYALPDKLTLELILAQLILQCLFMKEKSITVRLQVALLPKRNVPLFSSSGWLPRMTKQTRCLYIIDYSLLYCISVKLKCMPFRGDCESSLINKNVILSNMKLRSAFKRG